MERLLLVAVSAVTSLRHPRRKWLSESSYAQKKNDRPLSARSQTPILRTLNLTPEGAVVRLQGEERAPMPIEPFSIRRFL
jgi:hypothetical protein